MNKTCGNCADGYHCERWCNGKSFEPKHTIVEALEKQIPMKPIANVIAGQVEYICPLCQRCHVAMNGYTYEYCHNCGQKIDWSEE